MKRSIASPILLLLALACQPPAPPQAAKAPAPAPGTPEWKIQNALGAGPSGISSAAAVMDWPSAPGGQMTELRKGTNGWACMPDIPSTPGTDPMCLDPTFQKWAAAWMSHGKVDIKQIGFAYMLQGGSDASNTNPFATQADSSTGWINSGPHVMVVAPNLATIADLSTDYKSGSPWVMFQKTPYAHVMFPVKN